MAELDLDYLCNGLAPLTREMPPNVRAKGAFFLFLFFKEHMWFAYFYLILRSPKNYILNKNPIQLSLRELVFLFIYYYPIVTMGGGGWFELQTFTWETLWTLAKY